MYMNINLMVEN